MAVEKKVSGSPPGRPRASSQVFEPIGNKLDRVRKQRGGGSIGEMEWDRWQWASMPDRMRAHIHVPSPGQTCGPKDPESGESIRRLVQPPTHGVPLKGPSPLCQWAQREFHLSL